MKTKFKSAEQDGRHTKMEGTSSAAMLVSTCGAMCGQRLRYAAAADWDFASFLVAALPYLKNLSIHVGNLWTTFLKVLL